MERRNFVKALAAAGVATLVTRAGISEAKCPNGCNCPKCNGKYKSYKDDSELNRLTNKETPSILEKKHVPLVIAPKEVKKGQWFQVEVKVGFQIEHPSTPGHWIEEITILVDGKKISELENEIGGIASPNGYFTIRLNESATIEAIADCNLHGKWISEPVKIKVS